MYKRLWRIGCLGVTFLFVWSCAPLARVTAKDYEQSLAVSRQLMQAGQLQTARVRLSELWEADPSRPEVGHLLGECLYRMRMLADAVSQYQTVLTRHPEFHASRHRRWAALLAMNAENKQQVQAEVDAFARRHAGTADAMYTAYRGYQLLHQHRDHVQLLKWLASAAETTALRSAVAAQLQEYVIASRESTVRRELAALYLAHFPQQRGARLLARIYLNTYRRPIGAEEAESILARFPGNRHLMQGLAARLIDQHQALDTAEQWLRRHLSDWSRAAAGGMSAGLDDSAQALLRGWEGAESQYWLGVLYQQQGRVSEAQRLFNLALEKHAQPWRVYRQLYRLTSAGGNGDQAIDYLMRSLAAGNRSKGDHKRLAQLLESRHGYRGPAHRFFAAQQAAVTFTEVDDSDLRSVRSPRVAWGDYNNDGYDDLLLDGPHVLRNEQGAGFTDVTAILGADRVQGTHGGSWADIDNDGFVDLFLAYRRGNRLYLNENGAAFRDVSAGTSSLSMAPPVLTEAAAWGDYDNDGWLDLYLANYEGRGVERGFCDADQLLRNRGDGTFTDISEDAGVMVDEPLCGRGVMWADINDDGAQDIVVANYRLDPNLVWLNTGSGMFREAGAELALRGTLRHGAYGHSIGSVAGDVDNDGDLDIYTANLAHPRHLHYSDRSKLMINQWGMGDAFVDAIGQSGIRFEETNADPLLADVDNDGDLDLFVTSVYRGRFAHLYLNDGSGRYTDVTWLSGIVIENGWGVAASDYDRDGDVDLVVGSDDGARLLRNDGNANHWLAIKLKSRSCNVYGVGSRIRISYRDQTQMREVRAGRGTGSQDSAVAHFGLGDYNGEVDVHVEDLCGSTLRMTVSGVDRIVHME